MKVLRQRETQTTDPPDRFAISWEDPNEERGQGTSLDAFYLFPITVGGLPADFDDSPIIQSRNTLTLPDNAVAFLTTADFSNIEEALLAAYPENIAEEVAWRTQNRRRFSLIRQESRGGLTTNELAELETLQTEAATRAHLAAPRPIDLLKKLEEKLLTLGEADG